MKKYTYALVTVLLVYVSAFSGDPSEEGVSTSPVTVYSGGIGAGALSAWRGGS